MIYIFYDSLREINALKEAACSHESISLIDVSSNKFYESIY